MEANDRRLAELEKERAARVKVIRNKQTGVVDIGPADFEYVARTAIKAVLTGLEILDEALARHFYEERFNEEEQAETLEAVTSIAEDPAIWEELGLTFDPVFQRESAIDTDSKPIRTFVKTLLESEILEQMRAQQPKRFKRMRREGTLAEYLESLARRYLKTMQDLVDQGRIPGEAREVAQRVVLDEELWDEEPEPIEMEDDPELDELALEHPGIAALLRMADSALRSSDELERAQAAAQDKAARLAAFMKSNDERIAELEKIRAEKLAAARMKRTREIALLRESLESRLPRRP